MDYARALSSSTKRIAGSGYDNELDSNTYTHIYMAEFDRHVDLLIYN